MALALRLQYLLCGPRLFFCWFLEALLIDFSAFISFFSARFCVILKDWRIVGKLIFLRCVWQSLPSSSPVFSVSVVLATKGFTASLLNRRCPLLCLIGVIASLSLSSHLWYSLTNTAIC